MWDLRSSILPLLLFWVGPGGAAEPTLPAIPDREGFAGSFAGVSNGALIVAGGANFPEKKPWDGGKKIWHDSVFVLEEPSGKWKRAGTLPRSLAYGVSVTDAMGLICVGGSDAERHYSDAFRLTWQKGQLRTSLLPALPIALANASGALVGQRLIIAGGIAEPQSTSTSRKVFELDLSQARLCWRELPTLPGRGRMLATAASIGETFYLVGGVDLKKGKDGRPERIYLQDGYQYTPKEGWAKLAELPCPLAASPSPAPHDAAGFTVIGGDDGSRVHHKPDQHPGFSRTVHRYDRKSGKWIKGGDVPECRVTVPCVAWRDLWIIPGGEIRPGIRTPSLMIFSPRPQD
jgi:N-acetylneuraminic acid mutarotase